MRLIDADKLRRKVQSVATEAWKMKLEARVETTLNQFLDYIEQSPTIEPKRGRWITVDTEVISVPVYWNEEQRQSDEKGAGILEKCKCSVCEWKTNFMGYKKLGVNKSYNFCPNCGARMKEVNDE